MNNTLLDVVLLENNQPCGGNSTNDSCQAALHNNDVDYFPILILVMFYNLFHNILSNRLFISCKHHFRRYPVIFQTRFISFCRI